MNGRIAMSKRSSGRATAARDALGLDDRVDLRDLLAGGDVQRRDEHVGDARSRSATASAVREASPKSGSSRSAIAGSPRKPMPSEASVMPNWQADRYWLRSSCWRAAAARALDAGLRQLLEPRAAARGRARTRPRRRTRSRARAATTAMSSSAVISWPRPCEPLLRGRSSGTLVRRGKSTSGARAVDAAPVTRARRSARPARGRRR